jgi:hypothetical protein
MHNVSLAVLWTKNQALHVTAASSSACTGETARPGEQNNAISQAYGQEKHCSSLLMKRL